MRPLLWAPLAVFVSLVVLIAVGLYAPADRTIHSAMVDKPLPPLALAALVPGKPGVDARDFADGRPRLINVFASWCIPCAAEAPQLLRLQAAGVTIEAIAVRDTPDAVQGFLTRYGDPYAAIGDDPTSRAQFALGSSGVPESFLVDGHGRIVLQHVGDIRAEDVPEIVAALGKRS